MPTRRRLLLAAGAAAIAPGCLGGGSSAPPASTRTRPARLTGPLQVAAPAGSIPAGTTNAFASAHGISVDARTVATGADMVALVSSGFAADVVLARQDDIAVLGGLGLLSLLDHDRLPNLSLVDSEYLDLPFDRHNHWSAPARYGVFGFGYRRGIIASAPVDWAGFFTAVRRYSQQGITMLPGPVQPIAAALAALDEDINTDDDSTLLRAQALLLSARPHLNAFTAVEVAPFGRGELVLAMGTNADFDRIFDWPGRSADTAFVLPQGRAEMWIDSWAVPVAARNPATALAFIDFQLSARAAARAWLGSRLPAPEPAAAKLLPAAVRHDHRVALDPTVVKRYQLADVTPQGLQKRAQIWERVVGA
ncbi:MAG TPA: extracellular solute-binding protein [Gaiellales bacterium]|jgi:spermidine/putrescine transport system substrate-binding protein